MGGFNLTNPGLQYDQGQGMNQATGMPVQLPPIVKFFKNAALRGHQAALDEMSQVQPGTSSITGPDGSAPQIPEPGQADTTQVKDNAPPVTPQPKFVKPTMQQATTGQNGLPAQINPSETKLGKLVHILAAAGQGALAGWGQGSAGAGAQQAREVPIQMAQQRQQMAQGQAQTQLLQSQSQMVPTPYGPMPAGLAKLMFPAMIRAGATTGAAQIGATSRENAAETAAGSRTGAAEIGAKARVTAAQLGLGPMASVPQDLQDQFGLPAQLPLRMLNQAESAQNRPLTVVQGETGPSIVNKPAAAKGKPGASKSLGLGAPRLGGVVQVGDPNNPGGTIMTTGGQAVRGNMAGTQSASVQVPKAAARSEVPTNIGNQKVAFTTAIQHADLLRQAVKALNNGNQQTLNGLKNRFANEFGATGPITAQVIADAYGREVTSMLSKGHMTDSEIATVGSTVNPLKQNYAQIDGVLNGYQALAKSKMNMLNQQKQNAIGLSQPNKGVGASPAASPPQGATHIVPGPDGRNHYTNEAGTADLGIAP